MKQKQVNTRVSKIASTQYFKGLGSELLKKGFVLSTQNHLVCLQRINIVYFNMSLRILIIFAVCSLIYCQGKKIICILFKSLLFQKYTILSNQFEFISSSGPNNSVVLNKGAFTNYVYKRRGVGGQKKSNFVNVACWVDNFTKIN